MNTRAARTEFLRKGGYGFFYHFHYREQWLNPEEERLADDYYRICRDWNKVVENFDVEETARLLHSWNAGFFYLTIGQNAGYYCAPNSVYDRITGRSGKDSLCSRRDLISDLADALKKYEIPLIVYTTSNSPARCPEISRKLHFCKRNPDPEFIRLWSEIHREWAERWGEKIAGWWVDGSAGITQNLFERKRRDGAQKEERTLNTMFRDALRAGNPSAAIAWNLPQEMESDYEEDYTAREFNRNNWVTFRFENGPFTENGQQYHQLAFIGKNWCRMPIAMDAETMVNATRAVNDNHGAIGWDLPIYTDGRIAEDAKQLVDEFVRLYRESYRSAPAFSVRLIRPPRIGPDGERSAGCMEVDSVEPAEVRVNWNAEILHGEKACHHVFSLPAFEPGEMRPGEQNFRSLFEKQWGEENAFVECGKIRKYFLPEVQHELRLENYTCELRKDGILLARYTLNLKKGVLFLQGRVYDENPVPGIPSFFSGCGLELFFARENAGIGHEMQLCFRPDGKIFQVVVRELPLTRVTELEEYTATPCFWRMDPVTSGEWQIALELPLTPLPWFRAGTPFRFDLQQSVQRNGRILRKELFGKEIKGFLYAKIQNDPL